MEFKIIQIIPNNKDLKVYFRDVDPSPVICFALIEWEDGERTVKAMEMTEEGEVDFPDEYSNFICIK